MAKRGKSTDSKENLAKKIWLAGIGAYGKSFDDTQQQIGKMSKEAAKLFSDLVNRGEALENATRETLSGATEQLTPNALKSHLQDAKGKFSEAREKFSSTRERNLQSVDELMHKVRERMGFASPVDARLDELTEQVAVLTEAVNHLMEQQLANVAAKKPAKKKAAPKKGVSKSTTSRKAPAKTAAVKKTAAKKAPAKKAPAKKTPIKKAAATKPAAKRK